MMSFVKNRLLWLTVGLAVIFVMVSYINAMYGWHWPTTRKILSRFIDQVQLPAIFMGILISGNAEAPNAIAVHVTLFITYIVIFGCLIALARLMYKKITKR